MSFLSNLFSVTTYTLVFAVSHAFHIAHVVFILQWRRLDLTLWGSTKLGENNLRVTHKNISMKFTEITNGDNARPAYF